MPSGTYDRPSSDDRFWSYVNKTATCWEWTGGLNGKGYGGFWLNGKTILAHRHSYELSKANEPSLFLLHSCDNPKCVNPEHLREGTHQENMDDKVQRNRAYRPIGILNTQSKISDAVAQQIRDEYKPRKVTQKMLSEKYGICQQTISKIILNKTWSKDL